MAGTRVLVTGATGFTGAVLVRKLCERGALVRAIARSTSKRDTLQGLPIEWIEGNVYDPATVERAVAGVEIIFHGELWESAGVETAIMLLLITIFCFK